MKKVSLTRSYITCHTRRKNKPKKKEKKEKRKEGKVSQRHRGKPCISSFLLPLLNRVSVGKKEGKKRKGKRKNWAKRKISSHLSLWLVHANGVEIAVSEEKGREEEKEKRRKGELEEQSKQFPSTAPENHFPKFPRSPTKPACEKKEEKKKEGRKEKEKKKDGTQEGNYRSHPAPPGKRRGEKKRKGKKRKKKLFYFHFPPDRSTR